MQKSDAERLRELIDGRWVSNYFYKQVGKASPILARIERGDLAALKRILTRELAREKESK